jgi:hypothetical protein
MATFKDNENREWTLYIDIQAARDIRKQLGVDILDIVDGLNRIAADPVLLVDVLWMLVAQQAERLQISDEDFGRSLRGEAIEVACDAFMDALTDFSPPRQRRILTQLRSMTTTLQDVLAGQMEQNPVLLAILLNAGRGEPSPATPESSASTPDTSPSVN